jgi:hypothetical protein
MDRADEAAQFAALGVDVLCYVKTLDCVDVLTLIPGADVDATDISFALVAANGLPLMFGGSVGACMIAAEESGLHIEAVH